MWWQDKVLEELDKEEESPESNESDSEDAAVDAEKALDEKEKVNIKNLPTLMIFIECMSAFVCGGNVYMLIW